ncbi:MAG: hypothetical protein B7Z66_04930 [Chromatiales bacterium 21-64-14]|nr:MAG: hypothetical protein B7Z66_04930 [Chromatiales bacterium 21-64-14]HQU14673.1 DUF1614 domain-containing protein [Gammaproteobacteria bacterium]
MYPSGINYFPLALPFFLFLLVAFIVLLVLLEVGVLRYAYERIGIDRRYVASLLLLSLLGSYINIPVAQLAGHQVLSGQSVDFYGMRYVIPMVVDWPGTVIAVNVGGALIPTVVSLYLVVKNGLYQPALAGIAIVAAVCHFLAHPVPGLGIAEPVFVPPVVTAAVALLLARRHAAPLAYISGSLGTLIGADLLNLGKIQGLGAPVASIGGAGTFDGIFMTGILAVVLAGLVGRAHLAPGDSYR